MKKYLSIVALAALVLTNVAHAHAHLHKSVPADNSTVVESPKSLVLEFNEAVQITALTLQQGDVKLQDLGPLSKAPQKTITLALPALKSGNYIVKWRAVSDDSHVMSGKLSFAVKIP